MNLSKKSQSHLLGALYLIIVLILLYFLGEIILPFILGLFLAYLLNPIIIKIQSVIKNRNLAITSFLLLVTVILVGGIFLIGSFIVNDVKQLVVAVEIFEEDNQQLIRDTKESVLSFANEIYESELVQSQINSTDALTDSSTSDGLMSTLQSVYSFFESDGSAIEEPEHNNSWSWFSILIYTVLYTVLILYSYRYFEKKYLHYLGNYKSGKNKPNKIIEEFELVFIKYFKQRLKIVLICTTLFILTFFILGLPGALIIGILAGILTYADHFHYLSLPPLLISCWALSVETSHSFWMYVAIILAVFVLVSILEETVFFDKIMNSVNGMNPAIISLSLVLWVYIFGGFIGTIIALPLTQLIMIYADDLIVSYSKNSEQASEIEQT